MDIEKFHSVAVAHANIVFDLHQECPPILFGLKPDGNILLLTHEFGDYDEKQQTFNLYAGLLAIHDVCIYTFITEAWLVKRHVDQMDIKNPPIPSECDDKVSCILAVSTQKKPRRTIQNSYEIKETDKKRIILNDDSTSTDEIQDNLKLFDRVRIPDSDLKEIKLLFSLGFPWVLEISEKDFLDYQVN